LEYLGIEEDSIVEEVVKRKILRVGLEKVSVSLRQITATKCIESLSIGQPILSYPKFLICLGPIEFPKRLDGPIPSKTGIKRKAWFWRFDAATTASQWTKIQLHGDTFKFV
jgi:hypothetical protein